MSERTNERSRPVRNLSRSIHRARMAENVGRLFQLHVLNDDEHVVDADAQQNRRNDQTDVGPK